MVVLQKCHTSVSLLEGLGQFTNMHQPLHAMGEQGDLWWPNLVRIAPGMCQYVGYAVLPEQCAGLVSRFGQAQINYGLHPSSPQNAMKAPHPSALHSRTEYLCLPFVL